jgi:hypothetical protein
MSVYAHSDVAARDAAEHYERMLAAAARARLVREAERQPTRMPRWSLGPRLSRRRPRQPEALVVRTVPPAQPA